MSAVKNLPVLVRWTQEFPPPVWPSARSSRSTARWWRPRPRGWRDPRWRWTAPRKLRPSPGPPSGDPETPVGRGALCKALLRRWQGVDVPKDISSYLVEKVTEKFQYLQSPWCIGSRRQTLLTLQTRNQAPRMARGHQGNPDRGWEACTPGLAG